MWVKIDDAMPHHPKLVAAGPQAFALDVAGICYASRYDTGGFIADRALTAILPSLSQPKRHARDLCEMGRWVRNEERGGYDIHDYDDYQFTKEERADMAQSKTNKSIFANHKRWHERRGVASPGCPYCLPTTSPRESPRESHGDAPGIPHPRPPTNPPESPDPTRPDYDTKRQNQGCEQIDLEHGLQSGAGESGLTSDIDTTTPLSEEEERAVSVLVSHGKSREGAIETVRWLTPAGALQKLEAG